LWERVYNDIRTQVRSCRRKGVKVERSTDAEVLYQLYRQTYEKQGRRVYISQASFCELCDVLEGQKRLVMYVARMGGHAVSGLGVVKDYRGVAHEWVAGTDPDYLQLGAAPFVLWTAIEDLSEEGFHRFDLDGANVPSIARFKSQLGGELTPYYELMNQSLKAKIFDWGWKRAQEWGIADWLKQRWL
jgi:lipid II:glycine glycyltransferase (peptidoglycan interpeptide bridge formation enzyme)